MYCFDIVLNNADRLPGTQFWKHDGNEGNFLFGAEPGELYSIDQCVIVKKFQENYCCQVKELLFGEYVRHLESKVRTGHDANPLPSLTRIVEFLKIHYGGGPLLRAESEEASGDRDHGNNDAKAKRLLLCGFMEAARAVSLYRTHRTTALARVLLGSHSKVENTPHALAEMVSSILDYLAPVLDAMTEFADAALALGIGGSGKAQAEKSNCSTRLNS